MTTVGADRRTATIRRLTVRVPSDAPSQDETALRLRAERWLRGADLAPAALPPGAVLVVRQLHQRVSLTAPGGVRSDQAARLRARLDDLLRAVERPFVETVSRDAPGVLFADEAELLACLTRDVVSARARERWYWQAVLGAETRGASRGGLLARAWSVRAAWLPGACSLLGSLEVVSAVACLDEREADRVLGALTTAYAIPVDLVRRPAPPSSATDGMPPMTDGKRPAADGDDPTAGAPPWEPWLPAAAVQGLGASGQLLAGLALALSQAPARVREPTFVARVADWLAATAPGSGSTPRTDATPSPASAGSGQAYPHPGPPSNGPAAPARSHPMEAHRLPGTPGAAAGAAPPGDERSPLNVLDMHAPDSQRDVSADLDGASPLRAPATPPPEGTPGLDSLGERRETQASTPTPPGWPVAQPGFPTALGGVLYLVNVLAWLDRPDETEQRRLHEDWRSASLPGGWEAVDRLARGLLGDRIGLYAEDAIWPALAALAGREAGQAPGSDDEGDTRVFREAVPRVEGLLAHALGVSVEEVVGELLLVPGRLTVSRTHVDLTAPMDAIRISVRRIGLDRDPGWVPDLGRIVLFHFE